MLPWFMRCWIASIMHWCPMELNIIQCSNDIHSSNIHLSKAQEGSYSEKYHEIEKTREAYWNKSCQFLCKSLMGYSYVCPLSIQQYHWHIWKNSYEQNHLCEVNDFTFWDCVKKRGKVKYLLCSTAAISWWFMVALRQSTIWQCLKWDVGGWL